MRTLITGLGFAALLAIGGTAQAAAVPSAASAALTTGAPIVQAQWRDHDGWRGDRWRERRWREREWRHRHDWDGGWRHRRCWLRETPWGTRRVCRD